MKLGGDFAIAGDEWMVAYALAPSASTRFAIFSAGFATELYLKAAMVELYADRPSSRGQTKNLRHDLGGLIAACRDMDPSFMDWFDLVPEMLSKDVDPWRWETYQRRISQSQRLTVANALEFYQANRALSDVRYRAGRVRDMQPDERKPLTIWNFGHSVFWPVFLRRLRAEVWTGRGENPELTWLLDPEEMHPHQMLRARHMAGI